MFPAIEMWRHHWGVPQSAGYHLYLIALMAPSIKLPASTGRPWGSPVHPLYARTRPRRRVSPSPRDRASPGGARGGAVQKAGGPKRKKMMTWTRRNPFPDELEGGTRPCRAHSRKPGPPSVPSPSQRAVRRGPAPGPVHARPAPCGPFRTSPRVGPSAQAPAQAPSSKPCTVHRPVSRRILTPCPPAQRRAGSGRRLFLHPLFRMRGRPGGGGFPRPQRSFFPGHGAASRTRPFPQRRHDDALLPEKNGRAARHRGGGLLHAVP